MSAVLFAPHRDDETLFASFTCLREKPDVIVCLDAGGDVTETNAAMEVLGCVWMQWPFRAQHPDWDSIREQIAIQALEYDHCFAPEPAWVANGHEPHRATPDGWGVLQHDRIGQFALEAFGPDRFTGYHTYTRWGGKVREGIEVAYEPEWLLFKLRALACYRTQIMYEATAPHFAADLSEWYA